MDHESHQFTTRWVYHNIEAVTMYLNANIAPTEQRRILIQSTMGQGAAIPPNFLENGNRNIRILPISSPEISSTSDITTSNRNHQRTRRMPAARNTRGSTANAGRGRPNGQPPA